MNRIVLSVAVALLAISAPAVLQVLHGVARADDAPASKPADAAAVLNKRVPAALHFDNTALADVLDQLSNSARVAFTADWDEIRKLRIDVTTPVTATIDGGHTLREVLDLLLPRIDPQGRLAYRVDGQTVELTVKPAQHKG